MRRALACLLVAGIPTVTRAATFLYLSSAGPEEPTLGGRRIRLAEPDSSYPYPSEGGGLTLVFNEPGHSNIAAYFVPPRGERFAAGSYDGAADCGYTDRPGVCVVDHDHFGAPTAGQIEVLEAIYGPSGDLVHFAADFVQQGVAAGSALTGSIRFNAGDGTCEGAPDRTPCDDFDACSEMSTCFEGHCTGPAAECVGPLPAPCRDPPVCDPVARTCGPPTVWRDGVTCESENLCETVGHCEVGVCTNAPPTYCWDDNHCTYDDCDSRIGCFFPPIPGVCGHDGVPAEFAFVRRTLAVAATSWSALSTPEAGMGVALQSDGTVSVGGDAIGSVKFAPPPGGRLVAGTYENAAVLIGARSAGQAALETSIRVRPSCAPSRGRFVVHELDGQFREGDRGIALTFSADFEQDCSDGGSIMGSVRLRAGDSSCFSARNGTVCDDLNACTAKSTCRNGSCRGEDPVACSALPCRASSMCDPTNGTCYAGEALHDGIRCDDPASCTVGGRCNAGSCAAEEPPCDDGNPCTLDRCDGEGDCGHGALPGCFLVSAKVRISAQASGTFQGRSVECHTARCQRAGQGVLFIPGDGTYREPGGTVRCLSGPPARLPDEFGTARPTRSGRLRLHVTNRAEIRAALERCLGHRVSVSNHEWVQVSASGRELSGVARTRLTIFDRLPIVQTTTASLNGLLGTSPPPAVLDPRPAVCQEPLQLRCVAR